MFQYLHSHFQVPQTVHLLLRRSGIVRSKDVRVHVRQPIIHCTEVHPVHAPNNRTSSKSLAPVPSEPEFAHTPGPSKSTPSSNRKAMVSSEPTAELPKWSVKYHPEAKRVLEFNMPKVITYSSRVFCVKISALLAHG